MRYVVKSTCRYMLSIVILSTISSAVFAMINGDTGNAPVSDPGWPKGASEIFNHKGRIAWWEGPRGGGGEWHSECKGNEQALSDVLKLFAKIEGPKKRLVVLDGVGYSFGLDPDAVRRGDRNTRIDWSFTIWQADKWKVQKSLPLGQSPIPHNQTDPVSTITVNTAGLRWSEVQVPAGIEVVDNRLETHGFKLSDGRVIKGKVTAELGKPLQARIRIEEFIRKTDGTYGYEYKVLTIIDLQMVPPTSYVRFHSATSSPVTSFSQKHNYPPCKSAVFAAQKLEAKYPFWLPKNGLFRKSNLF